MSFSADLNKRKLYIGNLPPEIKLRDLEDLFVKYGKIACIDIKDSRQPPFAFIEYEDPRDAEDAVAARNGYSFDGYRLRVEFPKGNEDRQAGPRRFESRENNRNKTSGPSRRSEFRVLVSGLPPSGSWQDLKDHMREAGDVGHADVFRDGTGVCEFYKVEDMRYAIKNLDDTKFKSHEGEVSYIRIEEDRGQSIKVKSRSRSRSKRQRVNGRRTPTYSPMKKESSTSSRYSRSRSRS